MKLIVATPSPFARKARIVLEEKRIPHELVTDVPWAADTVAPAHNPLGKIPILLLETGGVLFDSHLIAEYLERAHPQPALFPAALADYTAARRWEVLGDGICDAVVLAFLEGRRPEAQRSADWIARQQRKIDAGLGAIAEGIAGRDWLTAGRFGIADIAAGCALGYLALRMPQLDWRARHPALAAYADRLAQRPSFARTVPQANVLPERIA